MSIETIGSARNLINNYKAREWSDSSADRITDDTFKKGFEPLQAMPGDLETSKSFSSELASAIGDVNEKMVNSDKAAMRIATGQSQDLALDIIETEKADIAFKNMMKVRGQLLEAYKEILRMQL